MGLKRRDFLQRTGLALGAIATSDLGLSVLCDRYQRALAQTNNRKLALLVGINQYREAPLSGCVTDVELQRELLIHRFGFQPTDILTLTDLQATRENIESAFVSHLIQQAKPGDGVVVHFSGYGSSIRRTAANAIQTGLVTADAPLVEGQGPVANVLLQDTLLLLLRSLQTDRVSTILDTSYTYPGTSLHGNLRIRAYPDLTPDSPSLSELTFQETLLKQAHFPQEQAGGNWRFSQMPGVVLAAAAIDQLATEAYWDGFTAGLFTYALTHQLWHATPATTLRVCLGQTAERIAHLMQPEQPQLSGQRSQDAILQPYFQAIAPGQEADGVITAIADDGKTVQLWLGGLSASLLEHYSPGSLLTLAPGPGSSSPVATPLSLQLISHAGLTAKAKLCCGSSSTADLASLQVGQLVRERVRVLPRNVGLTLALDSNLDKIERVDAISALSSLPWISSAIVGEQAADCVFSKVQETTPTQIAALPSTHLTNLLIGSSPTASSYGLFSPGRDTIASTVGERGEAVKVAVKRLVPKLQTLLAAKLLNLTVNQDTSQVAVRVSLETPETKERPFIRRETPAATPTVATARGNSATADSHGLISLPTGSHIQLRLENLSSQSLYALLLQVDSQGNLLAYFAAAGTGEVGAIAPGGSAVLPPPDTSFQWLLGLSAGMVDTYVVLSRSPLTQTQTLLAAALRPTDKAPLWDKLANPVETAQALLQDLNQASQIASTVMGIPSDMLALDHTAWASFRFSYQVV